MTRQSLFATLLIAALVAACSAHEGAERNKAGAEEPPRSQVLRLESTDAGSPEALHFKDRIEARSGGALKVEISQSYPANVPANEARLATGLRAGKVDFGILPARAWPAAGVPAFAALQAPFVIGGYDVAQRAVAGPAGDVLETALERAGVTPLALVPTQLRRVLAAEPIATLADFRGLRIRIYDNATSAAGLRALAAEPVEGVANEGIPDGFKQGRLDGVETGPLTALNNGYWHYARHITGYALFDRVDTLVVSSAAWKRFSPNQQDTVRAAAEDTVGFASSLPERDNKDLVELCRNGVRLTTPTAAHLRAIADATEPVRAALRADPSTDQVLRLLEATPGAGPQLLPAPPACAAAGRETVKPAGTATLPEGVYIVTTTRNDYQSRGEYSSAWSAPAYTWTTRLHDGKWVRTVVPRFAGQVVDEDGAGTYEVRGDHVTFRYTFPEDAANSTDTLRWSYYKGWLTLEAEDVTDKGARIIYTAHPWRKVR